MKLLSAITSNYLINVGVLSWTLAQLLKVIISYATTKKFQKERLYGAGGMPSSHTALVCSLVVGMLRKEGYPSPLFALAFFFAMVVMYDAMGVRRAAGEQAKMLNRILNIINKPSSDIRTKPQEAYDESADKSEEKEDSEEIDELRKLKEYLGHTPLEVLGGVLLGVVVAMVIPIT